MPSLKLPPVDNAPPTWTRHPGHQITIDRPEVRNAFRPQTVALDHRAPDFERFP